MNPKIKELAEQANIKYSTRDDVFYSAAFDGVHRPDMELLVELIVRECLSYTKDGDIDFMKFMIRKHFGVEE